jgi:hypothetical protein
LAWSAKTRACQSSTQIDQARNDHNTMSVTGDAKPWRLWPSIRPPHSSAVLGLVQDKPALRAGAASGILDKTCARRSAGRQVGSEEWSSQSHQGMRTDPSLKTALDRKIPM